jgi:hypothetical protein
MALTNDLKTYQTHDPLFSEILENVIDTHCASSPDFYQHYSFFFKAGRIGWYEKGRLG